MTVALEDGEWSAARPGRTLTPGKTWYPFYRRLGGPQSVISAHAPTSDKDDQEKERFYENGRMIGEEGKILERWEDGWRRREDTGKMGGWLEKKGRYWKDGRMIGEEGKILERWDDGWGRREDTGKMGG